MPLERQARQWCDHRLPLPRPGRKWSNAIGCGRLHRGACTPRRQAPLQLWRQCLASAGERQTVKKGKKKKSFCPLRLPHTPRFRRSGFAVPVIACNCTQHPIAAARPVGRSLFPCARAIAICTFSNKTRALIGWAHELRRRQKKVISTPTSIDDFLLLSFAFFLFLIFMSHGAVVR